MLSLQSKKHLSKLQQKKFRHEFAEFVIEGVKGVEEALNAGAEVLLVVVDGNRRAEENLTALIKLAETKKIPVEFCGYKDIDEIKSTETFPGILAVVEQPEVSLEDLQGNIICLDGIKDPGNLGTIIRTADWFGITGIILSEDCVDLYNPKVVRSTMGSIFRVKTFKSGGVKNDLKHLQKSGYILNGLVMTGKKIDKLDRRGKQIFILGNESHGIRQEVENILDKKYTILGFHQSGGQAGRAESLNVAVAAGILMSKLL